VNQSFPTLYEAIAPILQLARFGLCAYKTSESNTESHAGRRQLCQAQATVSDIRTRQQMCLAHFELVRAL